MTLPETARQGLRRSSRKPPIKFFGCDTARSEKSGWADVFEKFAARKVGAGRCAADSCFAWLPIRSCCARQQAPESSLLANSRRSLIWNFSLSERNYLFVRMTILSSIAPWRHLVSNIARSSPKPDWVTLARRIGHRENQGGVNSLPLSGSE
jgi:hypothetical protein